MNAYHSARSVLRQVSARTSSLSTLSPFVPLSESARVQSRLFSSALSLCQQQEIAGSSSNAPQAPPPPTATSGAEADSKEAFAKAPKESPLERKQRIRREVELRRFEKLQQLQSSENPSRKALKERARAAKFTSKRLQRRLEKEERKSWREKIRSEGLDKSEQDAATPEEGGEQMASSVPAPKTLYASRALRAALLAKSVTSARSKQPKESSQEEPPIRMLSEPLIAPGAGAGPHTIRLNFDQTEIVYPPSDRYPPPIPLVYDADPITAARALGILRSCEVEWWSEGNPPRWRKTSRSNEEFENMQLHEYLDSEQALEFIGDSALHLISRSLIMDRYPGKTVSAYNLASSWLVSNDCFAYIYEDSGLVEERMRIARLMAELSKKRELQRCEDLTEEERTLREAAPLPEPVLPTMMHLRQADLLEAYAGAVFLAYGFNTLSKWCTPLLEPWLESIGRTSAFHQDHFLSPSGEITRKAQIQAEKEAAEEKRRSLTWWGRLRNRFFAQDS